MNARKDGQPRVTNDGSIIIQDESGSVYRAVAL